jgi:hypothetical protein
LPVYQPRSCREVFDSLLGYVSGHLQHQVHLAFGFGFSGKRTASALGSAAIIERTACRT